MTKTKHTYGSRLYTLGILTAIIFTILRLIYVIDWHWGWVFTPLWGTFVLLVVFETIKGAIIDLIKWNEIRKIK